MFRRTFSSSRRGFTAIEVIMTIGTVALAAGLSIPLYRQYIIRNDLEIARQNVAQGIQRAKFLSQMAMNDSQWGFSTDAVPGRGILFMGETYATRNPAFDEMYTIPTNISINGVTELRFEKVTGEPVSTGDIVLTALNGEQRTVTVSLGDDGTVSVPEDWLFICLNPYTAPTTIQVPDSLWTYYQSNGALIGECGSIVLCGNNIVEDGEDCDDGNFVSGDGCDLDCASEVCGNDLVQAEEECDDGGESASCNSDCTDHACGDGTLNATAGEECDDDNTSNGDGCDSSCQDEVCGNSVVQSGEECDAGSETISCNADCTAASCGDGTLNATAGEECDDSGESASCNSDCTDDACGDGTLNATAGEECDDGNVSNGDGCDSSCETEPACGNGSIQPGEQCDDDNTSNGDGCDSSCRSEVCGNSVTQSGEQCDGGGQTMSCDTDCTNVSCGDGTLNATAGEECDDDNASNNDGCSSVCQTESCGDAVVQSSEQCDDGNVTNGDGCSSACITEVDDEEGPDFDINPDTVTPNENFTCRLTFLGAESDTNSVKKITMRFKIGSTWYSPFGDWSSPVTNNLNFQPEETYDCVGNFAAGQAVHVAARDWVKKYSWYSGSSDSHWQVDTERSTDAGNSSYITVLRDGDDAPTLDSFMNQTTAAEFVEDYVNFSTGEMELDANQVIYLFELGPYYQNNNGADFQDFVALVTLLDAE